MGNNSADKNFDWIWPRSDMDVDYKTLRGLDRVNRE